MSLNNLGVYHITPAQKQAIDDALVSIEANLTSVTQNLSNDDRQKFGSINETNKLLVNKCREFQQTQSSLASPDVDWVEFEADFQDRLFAT